MTRVLEESVAQLRVPPPPDDSVARLRVPPHSIEAEQSLLGGLLLESQAFAKVSDVLDSADFYRWEHRHIFDAVTALVGAGQPVDVITVFERLGDKAAELGGMSYLNSLSASVPSAANIRRYAEIIVERATLRAIIAAADEVSSLAFKTLEPLIAIEKAQELFAGVRGDAGGAVPRQWVAELRGWQPPMDLLAHERPVEFVVHGLIQEGKVGALVAAGGTGKTTLQLTLGVCMATERPFLGLNVKRGSFVLMSSDDSQEDLDGALARVVRAMKLNDSEMQAVREKVRVHSLLGLAGGKTFATVVGNAVTPTGLEKRIVEALLDVTDLRLLGLDTLRQFSGGSTNDEEVIKLSIAGANEVARQLGCSVVLAHHTGKANYRDGVTDQYCGSGSAAIADNSRFVLLLQSTTWSDVEAKVRRTGQERGDPLVLQSTRGSLLVRPPPPIFLHRDSFYIGRVAGSALTDEQVLDERDRSVLRAVHRGAQSKNAIATAVRGKKQAALDRIDELEARGLLRNGSPSGSLSRPQYVVTTDGARFLGASE